MMQVLTGHGKFGRFLHQIQAEETPRYHHYLDRPEDMVEHKVEVCPAWAVHRRMLVEAIGDSDCSRWFPGTGHGPVTSFCEAVMLAKVTAAREWERPSCPRRWDSNPDVQPPQARACRRRAMGS
ncbi:hypothetical protein PYW07_015638 [Mythimna separata]|uniref:Uncharacterized protein n=1 Tax=Mythimna separata TaxID=271217 RepID=A0AAD8DZS0_MYTSE|nr:hypothetical protein PYW07_015638 [Mythimna separata]